MNSHRIYTRKTNGLDHSVWLFVFILMFLSLGLLSFLWIDQSKCVPFTIKISPGDESKFYRGEPLIFNSSISGKKIIWDFGDETKIEKGAYVIHKFINPGKYFVKASINSDCDQIIKEVIILKSIEELDNEDKIVYTGNLIAGKEIEFSCNKIADSWTWFVKNEPGIKPRQHGEKANIIFPNAGIYTVQVSLNNDRNKSYFRDVVVSDNGVVKIKPIDINNIKRINTDNQGDTKKEENTPQPEATTSITYISNTSLKSKLIDVINDNASSPSLDYFNQFLDNGAATIVKLEGIADKQMNFSKFYTLLRKNGNLKIVDVKIDRDTEKKVMFIRITLSN